MPDVAELAQDGTFKLAGNINTRLPAITDGLVAHFPFDNVEKGLKNSFFLNYKSWVIGTSGSSTGFNQNGATEENVRVKDISPWGEDVCVWEARPGAVSDADGGWNTPAFSIDKTKRYRFSVWIRRTVVGNGSYYLGCYGYGSTNGVLNRSNGNNNTNPYFVSGAWTFGANNWVLIVGHVWPDGSGTGANHVDSGIYDIYGNKITSTIDFVWRAETTTAAHRTYLYYSTDVNTRQQFYAPRVDICDGSEPTIQDLINSEGDVINPSVNNNNTLAPWGLSVEEATTNIFPRAADVTIFTNSFNGTSYGFGSGTNIQQELLSDRYIPTSAISKISRILSGVSQRDYVSVGITSTINTTRIASFWYYGTYGNQITPYNNSSAASLFYLTDAGTWVGGGTSVAIPVKIREWQRIVIKIENRGSITGNGWDWTILHSDVQIATLSNQEYWLFTAIQVEEKNFPTSYTPTSRAEGDFKLTNVLPKSRGTVVVDVTFHEDSTVNGLQGADQYSFSNQGIWNAANTWVFHNVATWYIYGSNGIKYQKSLASPMIRNQRARLALVYDGNDGTMLIYKNGILSVTDTTKVLAGQFSSIGSDWTHSGHSTGTTYKMCQTIHSLSFYNVPLTATEIAQLEESFNLQLNGDLITSKLLTYQNTNKVYFPFDFDAKDIAKVINPVTETNTAYENDGVWLGSTTVNDPGISHPNCRPFSGIAHGTSAITAELNSIISGIDVYRIDDNAVDTQTARYSVKFDIETMNLWDVDCTWSMYVYLPSKYAGRYIDVVYQISQNTSGSDWHSTRGYNSQYDFYGAGSIFISYQDQLDLKKLDQWQRISITFRPLLENRYLPENSGLDNNKFAAGYFKVSVSDAINGGTPYHLYLSAGQLEKRSYPTPFTPTTRSNSLLNLPYSIVDCKTNFTIYGWWYPKVYADGIYRPCITRNRLSSNLTSSRILIMGNGTASSRLRCWYGSTGNTEQNVYAPLEIPVKLNEWNFFCLRRSGTTVDLFIGNTGGFGFGTSAGGASLNVDEDSVTWGWMVGNYDGSRSNAYHKDYVFDQLALSNTEIEDIFRNKMNAERNYLQITNKIITGQELV
jgi:hypothetical protein